jgi:hypothetical protein
MATKVHEERGQFNDGFNGRFNGIPRVYRFKGGSTHREFHRRNR